MAGCTQATLRVYTWWLRRLLADGPEVTPLTVRGFTMRTPKTLPYVPTEEELRAVLAACPDTLEGIRNRTLILTLADSGLRANEQRSARSCRVCPR